MIDEEDPHAGAVAEGKRNVDILQHYTHEPPDGGWKLEPTRRWFTRCDKCRRHRIVANYFEVYHSVCPANGGRTCWWWECGECLMESITAMVEKEIR